ncbi:hypothetical protein SAMN05660710_02849 [Paracoccus tibetensis]|uniref:Uncharacterized protein n=1 Tax=Paracoccus tibetensis TaxID=336292 RepID=A0A1G5IZC0_9RHOB|nr:hypothetical protein SAMN05660710_02849 [Paracoccus tibetensis]
MDLMNYPPMLANFVTKCVDFRTGEKVSGVAQSWHPCLIERGHQENTFCRNFVVYHRVDFLDVSMCDLVPLRSQFIQMSQGILDEYGFLRTKNLRVSFECLAKHLHAYAARRRKESLSRNRLFHTEEIK